MSEDLFYSILLQLLRTSCHEPCLVRDPLRLIVSRLLDTTGGLYGGVSEEKSLFSKKGGSLLTTIVFRECRRCLYRYQGLLVKWDPVCSRGLFGRRSLIRYTLYLRFGEVGLSLFETSE